MKKFLLAVLIVVGNLFLMSAVDAEIKTYTGTDEYVVGEHETHEVAKQNSKIRAMRNAQDQAGVFIRSRSRMKDLELVDDEVVTLTEGILKVVGAPNHEIRLLGDGKGVLIFTTIKVEIDTDDLDRRLAEIGKTHSANKPPIDRPKPIENPVPEKISPPPQSPAVDNIALSEQKFDEGFKLCRDGKFKEAIPFFNEALRLNPNNAKAYSELGWAYTKLENYNKAISYRKKAIELDQNYAAAYDGLAWAYNCIGEYRKAITVCDKVIELDPNYRYVYKHLGEAYKALKNYKRAIENYTKAIQLNEAYNNETYKWSYFERGQCYEALGQHDKARADFDKARQLGWKG